MPNDGISEALKALESAIRNKQDRQMRPRTKSVVEMRKDDASKACCPDHCSYGFPGGCAVGGCHANSWIDYNAPYNVDENGDMLKPSAVSKISKVLEWFPFLNFFYYAFFQTSTRTGICMVTSESITEIANNVALIAALLYTVITALPGAITWDELDIVDYHFKSVSKQVWDDGLGATYRELDADVFGSSGTGASAYTGDGSEFNGTVHIGKYGCQFSTQYPPWQPMSVRLGNEMAATATWLAVSFFLAILLIISISSLTRVKRDTEGIEMEIPEDSLEAWYWWARYHILGMLAALIWGVTKTLLALSDVYYLKFPQPWLENLCANNGWKPLSEVGEEEGSSFWEPRDEMPNAVKYTGGRFVEYQSSVWRGWTKQITIGDGTEGYPRIITDITGLDPGKENGQSPLVIFVFLCVGTLVLGYAQACADSSAKHFFQQMDKDKKDPNSKNYDEEYARTAIKPRKGSVVRKGAAPGKGRKRRNETGDTHAVENEAYNADQYESVQDAVVQAAQSTAQPNGVESDDDLEM